MSDFDSSLQYKQPTGALRPIIPDNACIPRITAAAGTELADAFSSSNVINSSLKKGVYKSKSLIPPRGIAPSDFRPLRKIPHCCLPKKSGPYLSPSVAVHSLKSATDRGLGKQLPFQLANQPQAHPQAGLLLYVVLRPFHLSAQAQEPSRVIRKNEFEKPNRLIDFYRELAAASNCYSLPGGRFLRITHPFATVDPKLTIMKANLPSDLHVLSIPPAFILSQDQTLHGTFSNLFRSA